MLMTVAATSKAHRGICIDVDISQAQEAEVEDLLKSIPQTSDDVRSVHVKTGDSKS